MANWPEVWAALKTRIGSTWGQFVTVLAQVANNLPIELGDSRNVLALLQQLVIEATADVSTSARGMISTSDSNLSLSGLVMLATETTTLEVVSTRLRQDGSFTFRTLPAGNYQLQIIGAQLTTNASVAIRDGEQLQNVNFIAQAGSVLRGTVRDVAGSVLANVDVSITSESGLSRTETTDSFGRYNLDGWLPAAIACNCSQRTLRSVEWTIFK